MLRARPSGGNSTHQEDEVMLPSGGIGHRAHVQTNAYLRLQQPDDAEQILGRGIA